MTMTRKDWIERVNEHLSALLDYPRGHKYGAEARFDDEGVLTAQRTIKTSVFCTGGAADTQLTPEQAARCIADTLDPGGERRRRRRETNAEHAA